MNIALEQTEEYSNGQLKNKYGDAFIRGNNGVIHSNNKGNFRHLTIPFKMIIFGILNFSTLYQYTKALMIEKRRTAKF
ncbi:unnamed protein product [Brugia pahangi]|uniref:Sm domain-containing protein n=1 Tax=Brugia pahangi TaxID=6280 RepID=A0A0N4TZ77_BRUPA|nr:unnamed protein product [Brugia pahangi]